MNPNTRIALRRDEVFLETGFDLSQAIRSDEDAISFLQSIEDPILSTLDAGLVTVTKVCKRCQGSGSYSYCQKHGTMCFECEALPHLMSWTEQEAVKSYAQRTKRILNSRSRQAEKQVAEQKAKQDAYDAFLREHNLGSALDRDWINRCHEEAHGADRNVSQPLSILSDIANRLYSYGKISEKQVALALRLFDQVSNQKDEEAKVAAPEGRLEFTGKIVSVKLSQSQYGEHVRMTVKVETPEGVWLANGTLPAKTYDQAEAELGTVYTDEGCRGFSVNDISKHLRGREITLTATLTRGNDAHFAFAKRPAKVSLSPLS